MPVFDILFQVLTAALAVIGAYGILREILLSVLASSEVTAAVVLREAADAETLDLLLDEATRHPKRRRGRRVALLISRPLLNGVMGEGGCLSPVYAEIAERYCAEVFAVDPPLDAERDHFEKLDV